MSKKSGSRLARGLEIKMNEGDSHNYTQLIFMRSYVRYGADHCRITE